MPVTVAVNQMSVVHKGSSGFTVVFPDVCMTPSPAGPVPIAYPNIGRSADASKTAGKTKASEGTVVKAGKYSRATGDEAGTLYGIASNGALVTPDLPQGVRMHQSHKDLRNIRKRLPVLEGVEARKPLAAGVQPTPINRAVLLHAIAKKD